MCDDDEDQLFVDDESKSPNTKEIIVDLAGDSEGSLFVDDVSEAIGQEQVDQGSDLGSTEAHSVAIIDVQRGISTANSLIEQNEPSNQIAVPKPVSLATQNSATNSDLVSHVVDRVQLASMIKDFDAANDPIFSEVPDYISVIVREMLESDFLLVLGRGLGLPQVMSLFLAKVKQQHPRALILVLGKLQDSEDMPGGTKNDEPDGSREQEETIGFNITSAKRSKLYGNGGIYNITGPITVVDILTGVLDCKSISGLVIAHGEYVSEYSTIAFAIRLVKERNPMAFIKVLSDSPERLILPPSLPLKLRYLGVPTLMLWPRFHLLVDKSLPRLQVEEFAVEQALSVRKQQALLTELIQAVLSDIKRRVPHLDVDYLVPELGPLQANDNPDQLYAKTNVHSVMAIPDLSWRIRNALQGVWHQLSKDGRNSVHSLSTLQQLQQTLTKFDAQTFYAQLVSACRDSSQPWSDLPAVPLLLAEARRSVALRRVPGKFYHVLNLLKTFDSGSRVLIICDSLKIVCDLCQYLNKPEEEIVQDEEALRLLEKDMKLQDEEERRKNLMEEAAKLNSGRPGRRRVRGGRIMSPSSGTNRSQYQNSAETTEDFISNDHSYRKYQKESEDSSETIKSETSPTADKRLYHEIDLEMEDNKLEEIIDSEITSAYGSLELIFNTYHNYRPLDQVKPTHIIMYDPSQLFTREVERYVAGKKGKTHVEVFFMYYQHSVEELQYLTSMRREKDSFSRLIREKGLMPMHLDDGEREGNSSEDVARLIGNSKRTYQVSRVRPRVVVDIREFRSALPFQIWLARMDVVPLTLLVGDYVLTPDIVVERKSISDLIGSFRDGRLYEQCKYMLKHYKIAALLIEFDNKSHFTMEPFKDIRVKGSEIKREIQENLCTLMLRFPKLKLIWSSSPVHTTQIFQSLKELEEEPEPEVCAKAGQSIMMDSTALSMLEAMPGITPYNAQLLAKKVSNIVDLCRMTNEDILKTIGNENGEKLWRFITIERGKKFV